MSEYSVISGKRGTLKISAFLEIGALKVSGRGGIFSTRGTLMGYTNFPWLGVAGLKIKTNLRGRTWWNPPGPYPGGYTATPSLSPGLHKDLGLHCAGTRLRDQGCQISRLALGY